MNDLLNKRSSNFVIVLNSPKDIDFIEFYDFFMNTLKAYNSNFDFYSILHDSDIKDNGELKTPHYHIVISFKNGFRTRCATILNLFDDDTRLCISIQLCVNLFSSIRYLIHLDNETKYQYSRDLISTNNNRMLSNYLDGNTELENLSASELIYICKELEYSRMKILNYIGLNNFNKYYKVIELICNIGKGNTYD